MFSLKETKYYAVLAHLSNPHYLSDDLPTEKNYFKWLIKSALALVESRNFGISDT